MNQSVAKVLKNKMPFFARKRRFAWSKTGFFAQKGPEMAEVIAGNQSGTLIFLFHFIAFVVVAGDYISFAISYCLVLVPDLP
jgi:hypothetical protein